MIVHSSKQYFLEMKRAENKWKNKITLNYKIGRGADPGGKITFSDFVYSNKFPNNIAILKNGSVVVCTDLIENPRECKVLPSESIVLLIKPRGGAFEIF